MIASSKPTDANPGSYTAATTGAEATPPTFAWLAVTSKNNGARNRRPPTSKNSTWTATWGMVQTADAPWKNTDIGVPPNFPQHGGIKSTTTYTYDGTGQYTRPAASSTTNFGVTVGNSATTYTDETPFSAFSSFTFNSRRRRRNRCIQRRTLR